MGVSSGKKDLEVGRTPAEKQLLPTYGNKNNIIDDVPQAASMSDSAVIKSLLILFSVGSLYFPLSRRSERQAHGTLEYTRDNDDRNVERCVVTEPCCVVGGNCWLGSEILRQDDVIDIGRCRRCQCPVPVVSHVTTYWRRVKGQHAVCRVDRQCQLNEELSTKE